MRLIYWSCDCGGSNGDRLRLWKTQIQKQLARQTEVECHCSPLPNWRFKVEPYRAPFVWPNQNQLAGKPLRIFETILACIRGTTTYTRLVVLLFSGR